jgi:hypothetical protein
LSDLVRSNVSGLLELLLIAIPFVLPQLGVPSVLLLRMLRSSDDYQGPYGADHPLSFGLDDVADLLLRRKTNKDKEQRRRQREEEEEEKEADEIEFEAEERQRRRRHAHDEAEEADEADVEERKEAKVVASTPMCSICSTYEADVVNLPCAHRTWCGSCAANFVAPPSAPAYLVTTCHTCRVRVEKMILLKSSP